MKKYCELNKLELKQELVALKEEYTNFIKMGLKLNIARGKPCKEQLDLSMGMMDVLNSKSNYLSEDGYDVRNYANVGALKEAKELLADIIEVDKDKILIGGNSSLNMMFDIVCHAFAKGICGNTPWAKLNDVKFLCPVPGYDRHFAICEYFNIKMINIPMKEDGPDMDLVEKYVNNDPTVKGIWCVPKYSNPDGITYSDKVVKRFANLHPAANDFRIFWDNAYSVHHLYEDDFDTILEILDECKKAGNEDIVYKFTSTSKISFPAGGIAAIATSPKNIEDIKEQLAVQIIDYDKVNQLRHVRFFKNLAGVKEQMKKHANIIRPKFELVEKLLDESVVELGIGSYRKPKGGYFISYYAMKGTAKKVYGLCKDAGLTLTKVGATYPYGLDPDDSNIRIAPTYASLDELNTAIKLFICSCKIASIEKLLEK